MLKRCARLIYLCQAYPFSNIFVLWLWTPRHDRQAVTIMEINNSPKPHRGCSVRYFCPYRYNEWSPAVIYTTQVKKLCILPHKPHPLQVTLRRSQFPVFILVHIGLAYIHTLSPLPHLVVDFNSTLALNIQHCVRFPVNSLNTYS